MNLNWHSGLALAVGVVLTATAGFVLSAQAYLGLATLAVLVSVAAVALVLQIDRPSIALLFLLATAVAFPVEFRGPGAVQMSSTLPLSAALCTLWILRALVARDGSFFDRSRIVVAAMVFMGATIVSFAMGQFPWFPSAGAPFGAQVVELGLFLLSGCLFLGVGQQITQVSQLQWLTWVFVMTGTVTCVVQVIPALEEIGKVTTHPGSVGSLFWTWFVAVTVAQGLANHQLRLSVRVLLLGLALLALGHGLLQVRSWASGWLPPLVAIGVIVTAWRPRLTIALATLAVPVGLYLVGDVATDVLTQESYSLSTRQEAWAVLWQIVKRSPMLGTGLANYYYFAENYPILGWYVPFISHNNYQDLLVQTGVVGLLAFSWFALEAVWLAFRLLRYLPPGFPMAYALGTLGGVVGSLASGMLGDWIIPFYYNAGVIGFRSSLLFWVFLGGALALRRMGAVPQPDYSLAHADVPSGQYALAGFR